MQQFSSDVYAAGQNKGKVELSYISLLKCQNGILKKNHLLWLFVAVCSGMLLEESRNPLLASEEDGEGQSLKSCEAVGCCGD